MYKFSVGDKVICIKKNNWVPVGTTGIVDENDNVPFVIWDNGERWCLREDSMSFYEIDGFKVGDRVVMISDHYEDGWDLYKGTKGTIKEIRGQGSLDVCFDNYKGGHSGMEDSDVRSHLYVHPIHVMKIKENNNESKKGNIVLFRQGNKVIAKLTYGKSVIHTAEAACNPEDPFDFLIGSQIVLQRLVEKIRGEDTVIAIPSEISFGSIFVY